MSYKIRIGMIRDVGLFGVKKFVDLGNLIWENIKVNNIILKKL